uniref:Uncharacterized protein n=1 Tax=Vespula pensylvanica TaxID=30213 RepID=A0A834PCH6_VESPE|nr:hypothetical protein H0235_003716 [Vespula pensylvanica]
MNCFIVEIYRSSAVSLEVSPSSFGCYPKLSQTKQDDKEPFTKYLSRIPYTGQRTRSWVGGTSNARTMHELLATRSMFLFLLVVVKVDAKTALCSSTCVRRFGECSWQLQSFSLLKMALEHQA